MIPVLTIEEHSFFHSYLNKVEESHYLGTHIQTKTVLYIYNEVTLEKELQNASRNS